MALDDDVAKLTQNPTLAQLEEGALRLIAFSAESRALRAGDILFRRDEPSNGGYVLLSGSVALDASDDGSAAARIIRPPALIGELALVTNTIRPATAIVREPSTILRISRQLFHRVLNEFPESANRLRRKFEANLLKFTGELEAVRQSALAPPEGFDGEG
jgi:CRP-like cAMP-binding protein